MSELLHGYEERVELFNEELAAIGIEREELGSLDHLAYRTNSLEEYYEVVAAAEALGRNLGEMEIVGRPISAIALDAPLKAGGWVIPFLEIAAPKEGSPYPSGLEHAEFVTVKLLTDFEKDHPDISFGHEAMDRPINPELKYKNKTSGLSMKFHRLSLGVALELENEEKIKA